MGVALVAAFGAATFAAAPGCAEDESMVFVRAILPPNKGCGFEGAVDANLVALTWGALDWSCKKEYTANILIGNAMQRNPSNEFRRTDANRFQVQTIEVNAVLPGGGVVAYDLPASVLIDPAGDAAPSFAIVGVPLLPLRKIEFSRIPGNGPIKQIDFEIRVRGKTLGGRSVSSGTFVFPVRVGEGILNASGSDAGGGGSCPGQDTPYTDVAVCPNPNP